MTDEAIDALLGQAQQMLSTPADREGEDADDDAMVAIGTQLISADPATAAQLFHRAAQIAATGGRWSRVAGASEREVAAWIACGRVAEASEAVRRAEHAAGRIADDDVRLRVLSNLAASLKDVGLADRAIELLEAVIAHRRHEAVTGDRIATEALFAGLVNLATALIDRGQAAPGLQTLREAEELIGELDDPRRLGTIRINMAYAYSTGGDLRLARDAYQEAVDLYRRSGADVRDIGFALRGVASTLAQAGRFEEALQQYREAGALFSSAYLYDELARTTIGEVMARASLGENIPATEFDALERQLRRLPPNDKGQLGRNLGNIALDQGDRRRAERLYLSARRAFRLLGRIADVASVDTNRAIAARRAGDLDLARRLLGRARGHLVAQGRWRQVGHVDHNLALVLSEMAEAGGPRSAQRRAQAAARSISAVAALDRFRHDLPSARDRVSLEQSVYPGLFQVAIRSTLEAKQAPAVAALVERARVQPVLPSPATGMAFLEPRPIAARSGDAAVGGDGEVVVLGEEAARLAGTGALWVGWWSSGTELVMAATTADRVSIEVRPIDESLALLPAALAIPTPAEQERAGDDRDLAGRLALWRAARGPLLADPVLAERLAATLAPADRRATLADEGVGEVAGIDDATLLWPVSQLLLGEVLLERLEMIRAAGSRQPLLVAPPPLLGRIPWAALPITDPAAGDVRRLVEAADVVIALPASLSASLTPRTEGAGGVLLVADPLGDLRSARRLHIPGAHRLGHGHRRATRSAFIAAVRQADVLVMAGHVQPGQAADPASSAVLLCDEEGGVAELTVAELASLHVPATCVVLGCDGAGAATGNEWTGVATGLIWAGASSVVTTTWPVVDDRITTGEDEALIRHVRQDGPRHGLWAWQRARAAALRVDARTRASAVYRWGGTVVTGLPSSILTHSAMPPEAPPPPSTSSP